MRVKLIFPFLLFLFFVSAQRNRAAEDSARIQMRQKYFFEKEGKFGILSEDGKKLTKAEFDEVIFFNNDYFLVKKDTLVGLLDKSAKTIIPIKYKDIKDSESNFYGENKEKAAALQKEFKNVFFAYTNDDYYDEQFGIYSKDGKLIYPPVIHWFSEIKYFKDSTYLILIEYPEIKSFTAQYNGAVMKTQGTRLMKFKNGIFESIPIQVNYSDLKFLNIKNKNIVYYKNGYKGGFYNLESDKKTDRKYIDYGISDNRIYAKKEKFYNFIFDENFKETVSRDSINRVENNYLYIAEGANMRLMRNGKKAKFAYPLIATLNDYNVNSAYRNYFKDEEYQSFLSNLFEFYPVYSENSKNKLHGIINFEGKIFIEPKYDYVSILPLRKFIGESYNESKPEYYKKNHLDYLFVPGGFYSPGGIYYKEFRIINSIGKEIVYINSETFGKLNKENPVSYRAKQGITKDFYYRNFSNQSGFFVYDITHQKIILESDKGSFDLRKNGGFLERFYDVKNSEQTLTYYRGKLKKLYEEKMNCKNFEECNRQIVRSKEIYFFKNNKTGLIDFDEKKVLPAIYDSITIINYHSVNQYNISEEDLTTSFAVTKNGKTALLNDKYKEIIPSKYDDIKLVNNPYFEAYLVKKNNKYGLISKNNIVLVPIKEDYEIIYNSDHRYFEIKNQFKYAFSQDYGQKDVWYNPKNPKHKFLIKEDSILDLK